MQSDQPEAIWRPSPNFGPRRDQLRPSLIVLHFTAMASAHAALDRLCDPAAEVSAHYLIGQDGQLWQMVREADRAWHAGAGQWAGQQDINSRSIGIELDNCGDHPFSAAQMSCLETLMRGIMARWSIPASGVIGHSCMAPGRKSDPGSRFDWLCLARSGLALPPGTERPGTEQPEQDQEAVGLPARFRALAQARGFTAEATDSVLLEAVRLRFRPAGRGPLSMEDLTVLTGPKGYD
ncbi:N-acetylmuramoyl-L-alanine amidase [Phaeobacter sp.]|uniref:N-acetylmuramoyl-L-alanine amidase n=1 Tax=Phaeobacter sp. TaxID=1902409 RepID=UPI0025D17182|nr:N-acetylmuramoyl-L-alanine amidase [Phaeobacter sp.]